MQEKNKVFGVQLEDDDTYTSLIVQELNIPVERIKEFNLKPSRFFIHGIVGLKNPQFMINSVKPEEIGLNQNITSPNLGIFQSSLCRGYFICRTPGPDEQLIDNSFPTFEVSTESIDCHTFDKSTSDKYQLPAQMIANNHRQSFSHALCTITEKNTKKLSKTKLPDVNPEDRDSILLL